MAGNPGSSNGQPAGLDVSGRAGRELVLLRLAMVSARAAITNSTAARQRQL